MCKFISHMIYFSEGFHNKSMGKEVISHHDVYKMLSI